MINGGERVGGRVGLQRLGFANSVGAVRAGPGTTNRHAVSSLASRIWLGVTVVRSAVASQTEEVMGEDRQFQ